MKRYKKRFFILNKFQKFTNYYLESFFSLRSNFFRIICYEIIYKDLILEKNKKYKNNLKKEYYNFFQQNYSISLKDSLAENKLVNEIYSKAKFYFQKEESKENIYHQRFLSDNGIYLQLNNPLNLIPEILDLLVSPQFENIFKNHPNIRVADVDLIARKENFKNENQLCFTRDFNSRSTIKLFLPLQIPKQNFLYYYPHEFSNSFSSLKYLIKKIF